MLPTLKEVAFSGQADTRPDPLGFQGPDLVSPSGAGDALNRAHPEGGREIKCIVGDTFKLQRMRS